jgi:hypothetical protein
MFFGSDALELCPELRSLVVGISVAQMKTRRCAPTRTVVGVVMV